MRRNNLPNFLVVGIQRTGTTWLYRVLKTHPDVFLPYLKEIHFFDNNFSKGVDWYKKHYLGHNNEKCIGDITPNYIHELDNASKIYKLIPESKILIILRNPIDFLYSIYKRRKRITASLKSFDEFFNKTNYPQMGFFFEKVLAYYNLFSEDRICINYYEKLRKNKELYIGDICNFLDIDSSKIEADLYEVVNPTVEPRIVIVHKAAHQIVKMARKLDSKHLTLFLRKIRPYFNNSFYMRHVGGQDKEELTQDQIEQLRDFYFEDVLQLSKLLEKDLVSYWGFSKKG